MKKTKVFAGNTRLKDIYVGATKWEVIKYKTARFLRKVFILSFIAGMVYGAFQLGKYTTQAEVSYAKEIIEIKNDTLPPVMQRIAQCESGNKQFKADGKVLRGRTSPQDIGKFQIRETVWNDKARELGYDIYTEKGNTDMAIWIYAQRGTLDWYSSEKCWR